MTTENNRLAAIYAAQRLHRLFTAVIVGNENVNNDGGISTFLTTLIKSGEEEAWKLVESTSVWGRVRLDNVALFTCKTKALVFNVRASLMVNYAAGTVWLDINVPDKQVHATIHCSHLKDTLTMKPSMTAEIASLWGSE